MPSPSSSLKTDVLQYITYRSIEREGASERHSRIQLLSTAIPINAANKSKKDELQTKTISENQALHILPILPSDLETICFHLRQPFSVSVSWNHGIDRIPQYCKISLSQISLSVEIFISIFNLCSWMLNKKIPPLVPNVVVYPGSSAGLSSMGIAGLAAVALAAGRPTTQRGSIAVQAYDAWLEAQRKRCVVFFSCFMFFLGNPFLFLE